MDFTNRSTQSRVSAPAPQQNSGNVVSTRNDNSAKQRRPFGGKWFKISSVILLFSGTILVVAVLLFINLGNPTPETKYVNKNDYQAVFINANGINGGQVWFGHIDNMSDTYIHLTNVFYIQSSNTGSSSSSSSNSSSSNSYTLIKIGCEIHGPEDGMTINRSQVLYWENLKSSGQVAQKIAQYYKQNPNGQNCSSTPSSSATSTEQNNSDANSTTSNNNSTTPSSNSTSSNTSSNSSSNSSTSNNSSNKSSTSGQ